MDNFISPDNYGQDRTQVKRFLANEEERADMPLYQQAGVAAIATAGLLALGHRTGAIRKITKYLDVQGRAVMQAAKETIEEEGALFRNISMDRAKKSKDKFLTKRREIMNEKIEAQKNLLSSREFQMEAKLKERRAFVGEKQLEDGKEVYKGIVPFHVDEGLRFKQVMDDLRKEYKGWEKDDKDIFDKIERAIGRGKTGLLNVNITPEKSEIKHILKNNGIADDKDKHVEALQRIRQRYRGSFIESDSIDVLGAGNQRRTITKNGKKIVEEIMRKTNKITAEELQTVTRKNGKIKDAMIGHKQATVDDILKLHREKKYELNETLLAKIEDVKKHNKDFGRAIWDENLYIDKNKGDLFDYKLLDDAKRKSLEWFSGTLPGMLMKTGEILHVRNAREQASFRVMKQRTVQPVLNGHMKREADRELEEDVLYVNGLAVRLFDDGKEFNPLNTKRKTGEYNRFYLSTSRYGTMAKIQRSAAGLMTEEEKVTIGGNKKPRNLFEKFFDLRAQDQESQAMNILSVATKFNNPDWERKKINNLMKNGITELSDFYDLKTYLDKYSSGFNQRTLSKLIDNAPSLSLGDTGMSLSKFFHSENINFGREEDVLKMFEFIGAKDLKGSTKEFQNLYRRYEQNKNEILLSTNPIGENSILFGGDTRIQTGHDVVKQTLSLEIMNRMVNTRNMTDDAPKTVMKKLLDQTKSLHDAGEIRKKDVESFNDLMTNFMFKDASSIVRAGDTTSTQKVNELLASSGEIADIFQYNLKDLVKRNNSLLEPFSSIKPINKIEDEFMIYNAAFNETTFDGRVKEFFTNFPAIAKQTSLFTGRKNMEDFTALSMVGYYMPYRLQNALGQVGLGFSDNSMKSSFDIWKNLFVKRFAPISAGVVGYQYADYELEEATGAGLTERYQNMIANRRLSDAEDRDMSDIEKAKRKQQLMPGSEQFDLYPTFELPVIGEVSPERTIAKVTAGILSGGMYAPSAEDTMSYDEVMYDLEYGTDEIRKGRWWAFGSKTAFAGDKAVEFAPNAFRRAHSDYEYTDTMYGDGENWENSWMPNARNPLGALGFLVGTANPYWFEEKHYDDRPYMLTGELFNANTPILGDIGNATIGRLIKPVKEMHGEYWEMGPEQATAEAGELVNRPDGPIMLEASSGGRQEIYVPANAEDYGADYHADYIEPHVVDEAAEVMTREDYNSFLSSRGLGRSDAKYRENYRYAVHSTSENPEEEGAASVVTDLKTMKRIMIPSRLAGEYRGYAEAFAAAEEKAELDKENEKIKEQNALTETYKTRPRAMTEPEYAYRKELDQQALKEIIDPRGMDWRLQELSANWMEPQGVYNWIISDELMGVDHYTGKTVVQRADAAGNQSGQFWEQELGSIGGQLSEIGRRFIRRDDGDLDFYNPIENTMPDWLPGENYFINFQTGDPYQKVQNGEYRLPGEAYESLNELHPDETGEYGAFDKFKILADVAPWSDEYRFWRDYSVKNIDDEQLRKQMQIIKDQVSKRTKKRDFYEYIFKDADVVKEGVTIKKFLDEYTFLTEEYGDTPIRLGGIDVRANAGGAIYSYLKEGDRVDISIDANPNRRISNDTYGTMKAVVYKNMQNINQDLIARGRVKELEGDTSAVGVHARFTPKEIRQGSRWESVAHYDSALNTKFLKVRSAVEDYERDQVYGKSWATWQNFAISDYLMPAIDEMKGEQGAKGFIEAGLSGLFVGAFVGRIPLGGGKVTTIASSLTGAAIGLGANAFYQVHSGTKGERYIPERRRMENDVNEYFDFLKYLKNMNTYEAIKEDLAHQGFNMDEVILEIESRKEINKEQKAMLQEEKRRLYVEQGEGWEERKTEINQALKLIEEQDTTIEMPAQAAMALYYKEQAELTLFAIDPYGDRMKISQALPYKDRQYFNHFVEANLEEQETLMEILPDNQKRLYRALWGYGLEDPMPIEYYMDKYNIPDPSWEGWNPEYNLDDTKVQVVQEMGLDMSDFNFWNDDVAASKLVPPLPDDFRRNGRVSDAEIERNLQSILEGQGYTGVQVNVSASNGNSSNVRFDYGRNREAEIENEFKENMDRYM